MVTTQHEYEELMTRVIDLQNAVNQFLGQEIKIAFIVMGEGKQPQVYLLNNTLEH